MELDGFLGVAGYYRWFIVDFSIIAKPLYRLNKKSYCQPETRTVFEKLKLCLTSAPVLAYQDFSPGAGTFILDTGASQ